MSRYIRIGGERGHRHRWVVYRNSDDYGLEYFDMCSCGRMRFDQQAPRKVITPAARVRIDRLIAGQP